MYISECVHFLFILNYRRCKIERTVTSLLFHVPTFTLCLLVVRSTSPCRQDHERTNVCVCVCVCVCVKSPEEWLVRPKYRETSSCFSLCCFVIYVYIFVCSITGIKWLWFCEGLHGFATKNQQTQTKRGYITLLQTGDHL